MHVHICVLYEPIYANVYAIVWDYARIRAYVYVMNVCACLYMCMYTYVCRQSIAPGPMCPLSGSRVQAIACVYMYVYV